IAAQAIAQSPSKQKQAIPSYLIRDVIGGKPYYYKGWQDVVNGTKTYEDTMGCSTLQAVINAYLTRFYYTKINSPDFWFFNTESGNNLRKRVNMSFDISLYSVSDLPASKISRKYANVPPKIVMEIDVRVDPGEKTEMELVREKTQELLDYGVEKILWIFTTTREILVAMPGKEWIFYDWNEDVEFMDGHFFNIDNHLKSVGVVVTNE
ncbi:MAG: hypothetical protein AAB316_09145, partial [Bacteroidota bacterium]